MALLFNRKIFKNFRKGFDIETSCEFKNKEATTEITTGILSQRLGVTNTTVWNHFKNALKFSISSKGNIEISDKIEVPVAKGIHSITDFSITNKLIGFKQGFGTNLSERLRLSMLSGIVFDTSLSFNKYSLYFDVEYLNYGFSIPVCISQNPNKTSILISAGLTVLAMGSALLSVILYRKTRKDRMTVKERRFKEIIEEYDAHSKYIENIRDHALQLNSMCEESKGLVIVEAYIGKFRHLVKISEKKLAFVVNFSSASEYENCQVIIASYHMIMHDECKQGYEFVVFVLPHHMALKGFQKQQGG